MENNNQSCENCKFKSTPRSEDTVKNLKNRLSRVEGQISGIKKMLDDGRYCDDILIQLTACKRAIESISFMVLEEHFETCLVEEILKGNMDIVKELFKTIKDLK